MSVLSQHQKEKEQNMFYSQVLLCFAMLVFDPGYELLNYHSATTKQKNSNQPRNFPMRMNDSNTTDASKSFAISPNSA